MERCAADFVSNANHRIQQLGALLSRLVPTWKFGFLPKLEFQKMFHSVFVQFQETNQYILVWLSCDSRKCFDVNNDCRLDIKDQIVDTLNTFPSALAGSSQVETEPRWLFGGSKCWVRSHVGAISIPKLSAHFAQLVWWNLFWTRILADVMHVNLKLKDMVLSRSSRKSWWSPFNTFNWQPIFSLNHRHFICPGMCNTNVDGRQKVMFALTAIRGMGRRISNIAPCSKPILWFCCVWSEPDWNCTLLGSKTLNCSCATGLQEVRHWLEQARWRTHHWWSEQDRGSCQQAFGVQDPSMDAEQAARRQGWQDIPEVCQLLGPGSARGNWAESICVIFECLCSVSNRYNLYVIYIYSIFTSCNAMV